MPPLYVIRLPWDEWGIVLEFRCIISELISPGLRYPFLPGVVLLCLSQKRYTFFERAGMSISIMVLLKRLKHVPCLELLSSGRSTDVCVCVWILYRLHEVLLLLCMIMTYPVIFLTYGSSQMALTTSYFRFAIWKYLYGMVLVFWLYNKTGLFCVCKVAYLGLRLFYLLSMVVVWRR